MLDRSLDGLDLPGDRHDFEAGHRFGHLPRAAEEGRAVWLGGVSIEAEVVAIENGGAAQPGGLVLGIGGHGSQDAKVVVGRVGGDLPRSASQLPVELVVDGVEEASLMRMVGLELLSFAPAGRASRCACRALEACGRRVRCTGRRAARSRLGLPAPSTEIDFGAENVQSNPRADDPPKRRPSLAPVAGCPAVEQRPTAA